MNSVSMDSLDIIKNQKITNITGIAGKLTKSDPLLNNLSGEDRKNFAGYIEHLGLTEEANPVILSSVHHYYYDADEMANVKLVINLKELNLIKELKEFLHSVFHILPTDSTFIGCFVNNKKQSDFILNTGPADTYYKRNLDAIENGIVSSSPLLNKLYNMIDSKTNKYLSERSVSLLFGEHGFKVTDFTEIDGLTYFCARKIRTIDK